jgi:ketosteroid isomerase-like protein
MINTAFIQQCYADFGKGNIQGLLNAMSDNIVWVDPGKNVGNLYKGTRNGKAEVAEFFKILPTEITITNFEIRSMSESGDKVFVEGYLDAVTTRTKTDVSTDWLMVWQVANEKVVYHHLYLDTAVLAAAL